MRGMCLKEKETEEVEERWRRSVVSEVIVKIAAQGGQKVKEEELEGEIPAPWLDKDSGLGNRGGMKDTVSAKATQHSQPIATARHAPERWEPFSPRHR